MSTLRAIFNPEVFGQIEAAVRASGATLEAKHLCDLAKQERLNPGGNGDGGIACAVAPEILSEYFAEVLGAYAKQFTVAIASILNLLSLDRIALAGGMMDGAWELISEQVVRLARDYTLRTTWAAFDQGGGFYYVPDARGGWVWRGAAVTWRDPSYQAFLPGGEHAIDSTR